MVSRGLPLSPVGSRWLPLAPVGSRWLPEKDLFGVWRRCHLILEEILALPMISGHFPNFGNDEFHLIVIILCMPVLVFLPFDF